MAHAFGGEDDRLEVRALRLEPIEHRGVQVEAHVHALVVYAEKPIFAAARRVQRPCAAPRGPPLDLRGHLR